MNPTIDKAERIGLFTPFTFSEMFGWKQFKASAFHQEYREPHGFGDSLSIMMERNDQRTLSIPLFRPTRDRLYGQADIRALKRLAPHMRRAMQIGELLGRQQVERDGLAQLLDRLTFGVILLDCERRILFANFAAEDLAQAGAMPLRRGFHFGFSDADDMAWLTGIFSQHASADERRLLRLTLGRRVLATAMRFGHPHSGAGLFAQIGTPACLLVRQDPDGQSASDATLFARLHGLTKAVRGVLQLLLEGKTPAKIVDVPKVTLATAKTHLSRVFEKTETNRQAELVRKAAARRLPM